MCLRKAVDDSVLFHHQQVHILAGAEEQHFELIDSTTDPLLYNVHTCFLRIFPCIPRRVYDVGFQATGTLVSLPADGMRGSK